MLILPSTCVGQTVHKATSFKRFPDSLAATLYCSGSGVAYDNNLKTRSSRSCCAYYTKKEYSSLIARIAPEQQTGAGGTTEEGPSEKSFRNVSVIRTNKKPLTERLWNEYEAALKKAGASHDAD